MTDKLEVLKGSLGAVESELLRRKAERLGDANKRMADVLDQLADAGVVDYCGCGEMGEAKKMSKANLNRAAEKAYGKHFGGIQVDIMDLDKSLKAIETAIVNGEDVDKVASALVDIYRKN